jgi:hypothetical protein
MKSSNLKRVGIIQSNYLPWRGYFDFIDSVDLFIILDDVQFSKGSWRNRNQLKTSTGLHWLTVPVPSKSYLLNIDQVLINYSNQTWKNKHRQQLKQSLEKAPFYQDAIDIWETAISADDQKLSNLNVRLIKLTCDYLKIITPIVMSSDYSVTGVKTERLIQLLKSVNATHYLSGQNAKNYLDEDLFRQNNICLEYKTYDYDPYPQIWGNFIGSVSVLDLIANLGNEAKNYITSKTPHIVNLNH